MRSRLPWANPNGITFRVTDVPGTISLDMSAKDIASLKVTKSYGAISVHCAFVALGVIVVILRAHFHVLPLTFNSPFVLGKDWERYGD
ncbi:MAG: hypothetical protein ACXVAD_03605 [Syntrophales bacterium]